MKWISLSAACALFCLMLGAPRWTEAADCSNDNTAGDACGTPLSSDPAKQLRMMSAMKEMVLAREALSPAERKLPKAALERTLAARGTPLPTQATSVAALSRSASADAPADEIATYKVTVTAPVSESLLNDVRQLGIEISSVASKYGLFTASMNDEQLMWLAEMPEVKSIAATIVGVPQSVTSQGKTAHKIDQLDPALTGSGVVIGVISEAVDPVALKALVTASELPTNILAIDWSETTAADMESGSASWDANTTGKWVASGTASQDGLAMLEVLHDIAPDAQLLFTSYASSTAAQGNGVGDGIVGMVSAIEALSEPPTGAEYSAADIIVDDLFFFDQAPFQDDVVAQAAEAAILGDAAQSVDSVVYVTSAGDIGSNAKGTASAYEADFSGVTPVNNCAATDENCNDTWDFLFGSGYYQAHSANGAATVQLIKPLEEVCLFWADPLGSPSSFYDLFLFDANGNLLDAGNNYVNTSSPKQCIYDDPQNNGSSQLVAGTKLMIAQVADSGSGPDRYLHLSALPKELVDSGTLSAGNALSVASAGAIRGQAGAAGVITAAAAARPVNGDGAVVAFTAEGTIEPYSADGNRRVFFSSSGTRLSQADLLAVGGVVRAKPDVAAVADVSTSTVASFSGTSAAAAHVAGMVALLKEADANLTAAVALDSLKGSAIELSEESAGTAGAGAYDAVAAVARNALPMVPENVELYSGAGYVKLSFDRALDDYIPDYSYLATCTGTGVADLPDPSSALDPDVDYIFDVQPTGTVTCDIVAKDQSNQEAQSVSTGSVVSRKPDAVASFSLQPKAAGVSLSFSESPDDDGVFTYTYDLECLRRPSGGSAAAWAAVSGPRAPGSHNFELAPGAAAACKITPQITVLNSLAEGDPKPASLDQFVTASALQRTTLSLTEDLGGFAVAYVTDPNIASASQLTLTLNCRNAAGQGIPELTNVALTSNPQFVEYETPGQITCDVKTELKVDGQTVTTATQTSNPTSATVQELINQGLPVWLLYIATQPE